MPFVNERTELGKNVAIDRDRNLTLTYINQHDRGSIWEFEFSVGEKTLMIWMDSPRTIFDEEKTVTVKWSTIKIESDNWDLWPKFSAEMVDAFKCYGFAGASQAATSIVIKEVTVEGIIPDFEY